MKIKLFGSEETDTDELMGDEYLEVNSFEPVQTPMGQSLPKTSIKVDKLNEFADTDRIIRHLRRGSVVFLKIKGLKDKDMGDLKRAVEKIRKTTLANNGDIAGVEQDWLILTPAHASVERE